MPDISAEQLKYLPEAARYTGPPVMQEDPTLAQSTPEPMMSAANQSPAPSAPPVEPAPGSVPLNLPDAGPLVPPTQAATQPSASPSMVSQTERTVQVAPKLSKYRLEATEKAYQASLLSLEAKTKLEAEAANLEANEIRDRNNKLAAADIENKARADSIQKETTDRQNKWLASQDEADKFSRTKPPEESLGQRLASALMIGLGAYASTMSGGPNQALGIINASRAARVAEWKTEYEKHKDRIDVAKNQYAFFREKGMDDKEAAKASNAALLTASMRKLDGELAGKKSATVLANGNALKAALQQTHEKETNENFKDQQNKVVLRTLTAPAAAPSAEAQKNVDARKVLIEVADPKTGQVSGTQEVLAPDPDEAKKVRTLQDTNKRIQQNLGQLRSLVSDTSQSVVPSSKARVQRLYNEIIKDKGKMAELGALSGADLELSESLGDPTSFWQRDSTTLQLIADEQARMNNVLQNAYASRGLLK